MTHRSSFRALPAHAAMGACFGLFVFLFMLMANTGGLRDLVVAQPDPRQALLVVAGAIVSLFAVACGLTGFLLLASEQQ